MKTLRVAFMSSFALDFFTMLSIALVALFLGLGLIDGNMNLPIALSVLILAPEYFYQFVKLARIIMLHLMVKRLVALFKELLTKPKQKNRKRMHYL